MFIINSTVSFWVFRGACPSYFVRSSCCFVLDSCGNFKLAHPDNFIAFIEPKILGFYILQQDTLVESQFLENISLYRFLSRYSLEGSRIFRHQGKSSEIFEPLCVRAPNLFPIIDRIVKKEQILNSGTVASVVVSLVGVFLRLRLCRRWNSNPLGGMGLISNK